MTTSNLFLPKDIPYLIIRSTYYVQCEIAVLSFTMLTFIQQNLQKQKRAVKFKHQRHRIENAVDDRPTVEVLIFPAVLRIARFDETGFDPEGEVAHDEVR